MLGTDRKVKYGVRESEIAIVRRCRAFLAAGRPKKQIYVEIGTKLPPVVPYPR